ncbi:phosphodiester glycosidase family protein [Paenibacillus xanthanilyticus]|uniref:Phosphodiester glycosidase family protein n=1 Tax=Paenibacillus xanthanilyticus TaxID=1783531 RepID=A0ABV8KAS7_9BACL
MNITVKQMNRFGLLVTGPFFGVLLWLMLAQVSVTLPSSAYPPASEGPTALAPAHTQTLIGSLDTAKQTAIHTAQSIKRTVQLYTKTNESMNAIAKTAAAQAGRPAFIYDRRITRKIGAPSKTIQSNNITAQLFAIHAQNFNGYALKVKLKSPEAMRMVLGKDKLGGAETTLAAVRRTKAIAGVNAGGFADSGSKRYPLGTTMVNGKYAGGFEPTRKDLFFVGLNDQLKLVGGKFASQAQLDRLQPKFGASFVPVLMKNRVIQPIPAKWQTSPARAPRTVIGNYKDNQLLFLVVDGYNENGGSGATLFEMQLLLSRFGAIDGYNLDGGGSSSLVFDGRIVNHPSDGQLRPLPTHFLFFD